MRPVGAAAGATDATGSDLQIAYVLTAAPRRALSRAARRRFPVYSQQAAAFSAGGAEAEG